jgi:MSHA biogenesis protein MshG
MKNFAYKALNAQRQTVEGEMNVESEKDLQSFFLQHKLTPLKIAEKKPSAFKTFKIGIDNWWRRKLFETELIMFTRQFAAAYGAGLSVARALEILSRQTSHPNFKRALEEITARIQAGKSVVDAAAGFPEFFDETYIAMLTSGELTGNLDTVLSYLAGLLEKKLQHRERIRSTLLYPKIVVGMIAITVIVVLIFVIPRFKIIFDKFESQLPLPTRILLSASEYFLQYWWTGLIIVPAMIYGIEMLKRKPAFMLWIHTQMLGIPFMGVTFLKIELTHFCTTFALLMRSGIRITDATTISIKAMRNTFLRQELGIILPTIEQGGSLQSAIAKVSVIPPLMSSMMAMGEESGTLDTLLDRIAKLYEEETEQLLKKLPTFLEPIILSILFCMVLFLALAVYLPMWKMASLIKK